MNFLVLWNMEKFLMAAYLTGSFSGRAELHEVG
jgi:hypothetical protein